VGIYLDDAFSSADITGNVFKKVTRAMMIGGGRDNNVLIISLLIVSRPSILMRGTGMDERLAYPRLDKGG